MLWFCILNFSHPLSSMLQLTPHYSFISWAENAQYKRGNTRREANDQGLQAGFAVSCPVT